MFVYTVLLTFLGIENRGRSMRVIDDEDIVEVKGLFREVEDRSLEELHI